MSELLFPNVMVSSLAVEPGGTALFAGTAQGIFVSRDGGRSWVETSAAALNLDGGVAVTSLACVPGPGGPVIVAGSSGAVLRSIDGSLSWQVVAVGTPPAEITALCAAPDGSLYAGTAEDGVFLSRSAGESWSRWNFGLLDLHVFSLAVVPDTDGEYKVLVGTETGLYISRDRGRAWRETDFPFDVGAVLAMAVQPGGESTVFAGSEAGNVYRSAGGERGWVQVSAPGLDGEVSALVCTDDRVYAAGGGRVVASRDGGITWREAASFPGVVLALAATVQPGAHLLAGGSGGIYFFSQQGS